MAVLATDLGLAVPDDCAADLLLLLRLQDASADRGRAAPRDARRDDHAMRPRSRVPGGDPRAARGPARRHLRARQLGPRRGRIAGSAEASRGARRPVLHPQRSRALEPAAAAIPAGDQGRQRQRLARPRRRARRGVRRVRPARHRPPAGPGLSRSGARLLPQARGRLGAGAKRQREPRQLGCTRPGRAGHDLPGTFTDGLLRRHAHAVHHRLPHRLPDGRSPRDRGLPADTCRRPPRHGAARGARVQRRLRAGGDRRRCRSDRLRCDSSSRGPTR